jgi:amino acid permease
MLDWIERMRTESEEKRRRTVIIIASVLTLLIVLAWLFLRVLMPSEPRTAAAPASEDFSEMKNNISTFVEITSAQWGQVKSTFKSFQMLFQEGAPEGNDNR